MRVTPIAEVFTLEADQIITCIRGTLSKLYKRKIGTNSHGEWSIQGGELTDGKGGKVELFIKDHEEVSNSWKGRDVIITAYKGDKGWSGLYAFDDEHQGKTTRKVKVTKTAEIALYDESGDGPAREPQGGATPPQHAPPRTDPAPPAQRPPAAPPTTPAAAAADGLKQAKALAIQIANAQILCAVVVDTQVIPQIKARTGHETTVELRTSLIMNMAIQIQHAYAHQKLPTHIIKPEETKGQKPQPPAQAPAAEAHPRPAVRPSSVSENAEWDGKTGSWFDPETGNYFF